MKTSERDLSEVDALFTLPVEDEADLDAVSAEFRRRCKRTLEIFNHRVRPTPTLFQRVKAWWRG